jgi:hypothetical protein
LLDSFLNEPRIGGEEMVADLIQRTVAAQQGGRVEKLGIARRGESEYSVITL